MKAAIIFGSAMLLALATMPASAQVDCETARCTFDQAVNSQCSCSGSSNHGRYVSCVAHITKALASCGLLPTNCKGKVTRCAARSTCGKSGFSTCTPTCIIVTPGTPGTCSNDPTVSCTTNADCGMCHTRRDGTCPTGTTAGTGSCCPTCTPPACSTSPAPAGCACSTNAD